MSSSVSREVDESGESRRVNQIFFLVLGVCRKNV